MLEEFFKSISIIFYEAICCKIFLDIFLQQKFSSKWLRGLEIGGLTGVFLIWALSTQAGGNYVSRSLGIIISIVLFSFVFYIGKWLKKIFLSVIFYAILFCVDYLGLIFVDLFMERSLLMNNIIQVILVLLCKTFLFVLVLLIDYSWKREREVEMKNSEWTLMISFPILTVVMMLVMLLSFEQKNSYAGYLTVSFGMFTINIALFALLKYVSQREYKYNQLQILHERNKEKIQTYYELSEDYQQKKRMLHDYNNQVRCIQGLLQQQKYQEVEEYAGKLNEILIDGREVVDVNNPIVNVVLNQKYRLAKSKNITISFYVNDLSGAWVEDQDMVVLLSNLLDNAIEASEKLKENKIIRLKLVKEKQQIVISAQNPVLAPLDIKQNRLRTSKKNKTNHGIGLENIQMVLNKYEGIGRMRYEKGWFYYTAIIPKVD